MRKYMAVIVLLLMGINGYSQKNNIYINAGSLVLLHSANVNYEFSLSKNEGKSRYYLRNTVGKYWANPLFNSGGGDERYTASIQGVGLFTDILGSKNFFELNLGLVYLSEPLDEGSNKSSLFYPAGGFGYRFEADSWLVRIGVHFPDGLYLGLGVRI